MNKKRPFANDKEAFLYDLNRQRIDLGFALLEANKLAKSFSEGKGSIRGNPVYTGLRETLRELRDREEKNYANLVNLLGISPKREEEIRQAACNQYVSGS